MPHLDTPQSRCRFGIARCDVTPPIGIYHRMWGAATHDRATGVHRPLTATVMIFGAAGQPASLATEQVLVAVDHCLLWGREMDALLTAVARRTGVRKEQIVVSFSHTHAGGLMGLERVNLPGGDMIPPYLAMLADSIAEIVIEARERLAPATITYGHGRCDLAAQRDFWDENSKQFVCGLNPGAFSDDTVLVARVTGPDGKMLATVVNYACHPTTLAWENTLISPDYPGAMREVVERATEVPCVFLQGASGDLGPREGFVGSTAVADRNGRQLGYAALAALEGLAPAGTRYQYSGPVVSGATLGRWDHQPLSPEEIAGQETWNLRRWTVDLPYRPGLASMEQTSADRARWLREEEQARAVGDILKARDARAMIERTDRQINRLVQLPPEICFPYRLHSG